MNEVGLCNGGTTSGFVRPLEKTVDMPLHSDVFLAPPGYNAPQQSFIGVRNSSYKNKAKGNFVTYKFYNYTSGYIHHCTIKNLKFNTKYYYEVGIEHTTRTFLVYDSPEVGPDVPYTFGLIGDLGQTYDSNKTLTHYELNPATGKTVLFVGDLSYADNYPNHDNVRWDTWGRFVERSVAYQPWIWTAGNHEIDFAPEIGETKPFKPYTHRYPVPYKASDSTRSLLVLNQESLSIHHCPVFIFSIRYDYHYMEGETMRVMYEPWFVQYKVDVVFAGHVHAYERSERVSNVAYNIVNGICIPVRDQSAPVYITIGDGGNIEGLATRTTAKVFSFSARPVLVMPFLILRTGRMLIMVGTVITMAMLWKLILYGFLTDIGIQLMIPPPPKDDRSDITKEGKPKKAKMHNMSPWDYILQS
ncbi:purple acid phosphatase 10 [Actinidia rufa]|uniref:Purple acid phosphatase n=1 Tax=Actinidia rufa TaxID=165716 RepID=A0A7J0F6T8_9ERIC|nr:purple acid phosphatase 10 [Actinidia rufa]